MSVYFVTGKLGAGKTLASVGRIRDYLLKGSKVATNLDIYPDKLVNSKNNISLTRLPDKPTLRHLDELGKGNEQYGEDTNGLIVLDELGTWFNSRSWQDKERQKVINWCLHARKLNWDIIFIVQDISIVDKQLRDTLCEHLVVCRRMDKISIPFIGKLIGFITGTRLKFPKVHIAAVHYGDTESAMKVDRWIYRGTDLYNGYDTQQIFTDGLEEIDGVATDCRTSYTQLSSWLVKGRYLPYSNLKELFLHHFAIALKYLLVLLIYITAKIKNKDIYQVAHEWKVLKPLKST